MVDRTDAIQRANTPTTPARIVKEQQTRALLESIGDASVTQNINHKFSTHHLDELESVVQKAKGFLFKFLAKLNLIEWLHLMNDACLRPLKDKERRKYASTMGMPPSRYNDALEANQNPNHAKLGQDKKRGKKMRRVKPK